MEELLKGNFKVKKPVVKTEEAELSLKETLKKRVLASLGGSMVYIERKKLNWDGESNE